MKRFNYKAKDKNSQIVTGEVEAATDMAAAKLVRDKGLTVISIKPIRENIFNIIKRYRERITYSDITTFTRQLSTMVNAGLPITEALLVLRSQQKGSMQAMVARILADVEGGESLSSSISRYPKVFSQTYVALVKSGEVGGVLDDVLLRLSENMEKEQELRGKLKGALIYPMVIVIGMLVVGAVLMIFVIPKLMSLYSEFNATLPTPTKILMAIANFSTRFWPLILISVGLGIYLYGIYRKTPDGRMKTDELILKIPVYGDFMRQSILTEVTRTLSLMVGSGVSILESLNITAGVVENVVIADALKDASKQVEKGFPIAFSFARHPEAFPYLLSQMIAVGEETGKMEDVLKKISHIFEMESEEKIKGLTSAIEPIIMIILGVGVGFLVIAVILPIYNLTSQF